ncbi:MAG: hypothetical protein CMO55_07085 [Verrucomicrobiales bacterium]|nr:hypothetical protein [Verrucomicrobiales bacterium]
MIVRITKGIFSDIKSVLQHFKSEGFRSTLAWLHSKEAPVTFQFAKYGLCGVATTVLHLGIFTLLSHTVFPAHDYLAEGGLADSLKERNAILSNLIAFPLSNIFAYYLNTWFVFTPGRHSWWREFLLFTIISFVSFGAGLLSGPILISRGLNPWFAQVALMVTSAIVNFVCRKFLVFLK